MELSLLFRQALPFASAFRATLSNVSQEGLDDVNDAFLYIARKYSIFCFYETRPTRAIGKPVRSHHLTLFRWRPN
jgi:hypothetical protein